MKYYTENSTGIFHAYPDDYTVDLNLFTLTTEQAVIDYNDSLPISNEDKILALEGQVTDRKVIEAISGDAAAIAFITDIKNQIDALT